MKKSDSLRSGLAAMIVPIWLLTAGCASLQTVRLDSRPSGAGVNVDGVARGYTPALFLVKRAQEHDVSVTLEGYEPYSMRFSPRIDWVKWILTGIVPGLIDGSMYTLVSDNGWREGQFITVDLKDRPGATQ